MSNLIICSKDPDIELMSFYITNIDYFHSEFSDIKNVLMCSINMDNTHLIGHTCGSPGVLYNKYYSLDFTGKKKFRIACFKCGWPFNDRFNVSVVAESVYCKHFNIYSNIWESDPIVFINNVYLNGSRFSDIRHPLINLLTLFKETLQCT